MGGESPSPSSLPRSPRHDSEALLSHVPGRAFTTEVLRPLQQDAADGGGSPAWLGPDGSVYKRVAIVAAGFTVVAVLILLLQPGNQPAMCREFVPQECFWDSDARAPLVEPSCGKAGCAFGADAPSVLKCPFASRGRFRPAPAETCDVGGEEIPGTERILPTCNSSCCVGDAPGRFYRPAGDGSRYVWQADEAEAGCSYFHYSSAEVLERLSAADTRLVFVGDSLLHQLWVRLIALMREQRRPVDFRVFTHARYSVCHESDEVSIAPDSYDARVRGLNATVQQALIATFFGRAPPRWPRSCRRAPLTADMLHATFFRTQMDVTREYLRLLPPRQKVILVVGVGNFEKGAEVPPEYLEFLDALPEKGVQVVHVATATKAAETHPEFVEAYQSRNEAMRAWAVARRAAGDPGALFPAFVDFDALSRDANAPPLLVHDTHYMCYTRYTAHPEHYEGMNLLRDRRFGTPVVALQVPPDAGCRDEMNRNLLHVIFNIVMKA